MIAAALLLLWINGQWFGGLAAVSANGRFGLCYRAGELEVAFSKSGLLRVVDVQVYAGFSLTPDEKLRRSVLIFGGITAKPIGNVPGLEVGLLLGAPAPQSVEIRTQAIVPAQGWKWRPVFSRWAYDSLRLPLWCIAAPLGIITVITEIRFRRRRKRERVGRCAACNYDRAGIAKQAVCPECGETA